MSGKHPDHYAILVGIARYAVLGEGNARADLAGPRNDVASMREWLLAADGGGLDQEQIFEVTAASDADGVPTAAQLDELLVTLHELALKNPRRQVGRRIYIYMSGHGFSPRRQQACLFTADAKVHNGQNVHATGWLNWLQDSGYFREFVLWVDACMNRASFLAPHDPPLPPAASAMTPLASFCAFAAQRPLKAVELAIPEDAGKVHGAFTWALLEGLRGAAADVNGRVTGRSLADWVRNAMTVRYTAADRENRDVAQEPEVILEDAGLIFARGVTAPEQQVTLGFPAGGVTREARLWAGTPPVIVRRIEVPPAGSVHLGLKPGLYVVELGPLRQGFEVLGATSVEVREQGPSVLERGGHDVFRLRIDAQDPSAEIFVVDSRFCLVDRSVGDLDTPLPAGIFKVKVRVGNAINQRVVLLDRDESSQATTDQQLATVLPLTATAATHEYHEQAWHEAMAAARAQPCPPGQSVLLFMARTFSRRGAETPDTTPPWRGLRIVDADGAAVIDLEQAQERRGEGKDPAAFMARTLPPGQYFLRQRLAGEGELEQSLLLCADWRTEAYVLRRVIDGLDVDPRPRLAVTMRRPDSAWDPQLEQHDRNAEVAKLALGSERRILTREMEDSLFGSGNPIAAIIGAHLLLVEHERDASRDLSLLDEVVKGLRRDLGPGFPDVEALALQSANPSLRRVAELRGSPLFHRSWLLLTAAAKRRPELVPAAMWARMQAMTCLPPFLVWNTGETVRSAVREDLLQALYPAQPAMLAPMAALAPMATSAPAMSFEPLAAVAAALPPVGMGALRMRTSIPRDEQADREARRRAVQMGLPPSAVDALRADLR